MRWPYHVVDRLNLLMPSASVIKLLSNHRIPINALAYSSGINRNSWVTNQLNNLMSVINYYWNINTKIYMYSSTVHVAPNNVPVEKNSTCTLHAYDQNYHRIHTHLRLYTDLEAILRICNFTLYFTRSMMASTTVSACSNSMQLCCAWFVAKYMEAY